MDMPDTNQSPHAFWEELYQKKSTAGNGKPTAMLEHYVTTRKPAIAVELGCAIGDDAIWLAKKNWTVAAVDISPTALNNAKNNAMQDDVADKITFEQHDLAQTFPDISCDLVSAMFLQTPMEFPRAKIMQQAAASLNPGGLLLIVTHGKVPISSWNPTGKTFPTAREVFDEINLDGSLWTEVFIGPVEREGKGPNGKVVMLTDEIVAIERR